MTVEKFDTILVSLNFGIFQAHQSLLRFVEHVLKETIQTA